MQPLTSPSRVLAWASTGLAAGLVLLWLLDILGGGLPRGIVRGIAVTALIAVAAWIAAWLAERLTTEGRGRTSAWVFVLLTVLSLGVRITGIDHEVEGRYYRDEGTYYHHATQINSGQPIRLSFVYPHLTYYADAFVLWLAGLFPGAVARLARESAGVEDPLGVSWLLLRGVVALLSALSVVPVYRIAERFGGILAGAAASLLLIFSPLYNEGSHLNTCDVPSAFFATVCLFFVARLIDGETTRDYVLAGLGAGLAAVSKYPAGVVAVAIIAVWLRWRFVRRDFRWGLLWAGLSALGAFIAAMPSLLVHPEAAFLGGRGIFFGARQYGRGGWLGVVRGSNALFYAQQLAESFGLPAILAGVTGVAALDAPRRSRLLWLAPFPAAYLALLVSMHMVVKRNLYPAIPVLAVFLGVGIAAWLAALVEEGPLFRAAAAALVLVCLGPAVVWTARQEIGLARSSTRELAAAWIREHVPPGAGIVKETYTPNFGAAEYEILHRRFATRVPLSEMQGGRYEYVLLASNAYSRFLEPKNLTQTHHRQLAARYAEIFRSFELVQEWIPEANRLGPGLRLYRIPLPASCGPTASLPAPEAFVPDHAMRADRSVRYDVGGQWALFKRCFEPGRYRITLRGRIVPRGPSGPGGEIRVRDLEGGEIAVLPLEDRARVDFELPRRGKYFFYVYLPAGSRLRGVTVEATASPPRRSAA